MAAFLLVVTLAAPAIRAASGPGQPITGATLTAWIGTNVTVGWLPLTVGFYSNVSGGVPPYTYDWNFADGCTCRYSQNATHTFVKVGTFDVRFTATDHANDSTRRWVNVTVCDPNGSTCLPPPHPPAPPAQKPTPADWAIVAGATALVALAVGGSEWRRRH